MHLRDRDTLQSLKEAMHPRRLSSHADGITAEKVQSGVKEQEDTRLVDTWLVGRGHGCSSRRRARGLPRRRAGGWSSAITMLTPAPPPSRGRVVVLVKAYKRSAHCKAEARRSKRERRGVGGVERKVLGARCAW